jgi:hypothetical protein
MGCADGVFSGVEVDCLRITEKDRQVLVCHRKEEAAESERASEIVQLSLNNKFKRTRLGTSYSPPFPNHNYQG